MDWLDDKMDWLDLLSKIEDPDRGEPMYWQITRRMKQSIESGLLPHNTKLPTNRELSALLKIDRSTVSRAYSELSRAGLIESHVGRGTYVRSVYPAGSSVLEKGAGTTDTTGDAGFSWTNKFSRASDSVFDLISNQPSLSQTRTDNISFAGGIPTEEFYPHDQFERMVEQILQSENSREMFGYSPAEGHPLLRSQVLKYLQGKGIEASDDELLIVSGSQQGIDLVSEVFVNPGDNVLLEDPSYFWAICNFRARQARCLPVSLDDDGVRLDVLQSYLRNQECKLIYVIPSFQNPTGACMSLERRERLLQLAKRYQTPILEDNFVGELYYDQEPLPPLRALPGSSNLVIHQGTFSKALCPGLRLGWIVAPPEVIARLCLAKRVSDLSTNSMAQVVLARYLEEGLYSRHLDHVRLSYKKRRDAMLSALSKHLGSVGGLKPSWKVPSGGLFLWMKLPDGLPARELLTFAEAEGVTFSPGELFFQVSHPEYLRLCFIQTNEALIEEGIKRLSTALKRYMQSVLERGSSQQSFMRNRDQVLI